MEESWHQSRRRHGSQGRRIRRGDNEDILELARAYPQTFIPFAGLNPYDADLPDRVDALARQGFRGVCLDGGWRRSFASHRKNGRVTLDRKRLNEELETLLGEQDARTLLARCEKQGDPFERLYALSL